MSTFDVQKEGMNSLQFLRLSPAIIYQLDSQVCLRQSHKTHDHSLHSNATKKPSDVWSIPAKVWGFSTLAVLVISLVGLLGVVIVPFMQKVFYNHLLQFLVALAVGSLTGDALLHLIPHAMMSSDGHDHSDRGHGHDKSNVWKGMMALGGVYFFFLMERLVSIYTDMRHNRKKKKTRAKKADTSKGSSIELQAIGAKLSDNQQPAKDCGESIMIVHGNKAVRSYADQVHDEEYGADCNIEEVVGHSHQRSHGHAHGHSHGPMPTTVSAIAWMLIMGDGLHNFCDGLAIGAAFSYSMSGGLSTSVAIFCHELPHELGDFAVLLRAGMSVKQALTYNIVSSVLCFLGMLIGVSVGNIGDASVYIFAIMGGVFIYIALVDMLPEMNAVTPKPGENPFCHLIFQNFGLLTGITILALIAMYEEKLAVNIDLES